ncbi:hypothetical protein AB0I28_36050 [Phytomonospora sp. NPDC050363]|uniref:hypothetical protein n=1 Tax=Phytomonospora sp. NPDC050363 TaxID=3155642 RepID=UPI0033FD3857
MACLDSTTVRVPGEDATELGLGFGLDRLSPERAQEWLDRWIAAIGRLCADPAAPAGKE